MTRLDEIKDYVDREFRNLYKSKNRARSLQGILTKQELLKDHLEEFETRIKTYEHRLRTEDWNKLTDDLEFVRTKVSQSLKILSGTAITPKRVGNQQRRNSDYCLEIHIPAPEQEEISQIWENPQLSSSLKTSTETKELPQFLEYVDSGQAALEESTNQERIEEIDLDNTSFIKTLDNLKTKFYRYSCILNNSVVALLHFS